MAEHKSRRSILSLKSWLFTPAPKADRFGRAAVHYVVTENGVANLKGLCSTERAQALIALAHPAFQDGLTAAAKENHLL